jgi:hypothetical protein
MIFNLLILAGYKLIKKMSVINFLPAPLIDELPTVLEESCACSDWSVIRYIIFIQSVFRIWIHFSRIRIWIQPETHALTEQRPPSVRKLTTKFLFFQILYVIYIILL